MKNETVIKEPNTIKTDFKRRIKDFKETKKEEARKNKFFGQHSEINSSTRPVFCNTQQPAIKFPQWHLKRPRAYLR